MATKYPKTTSGSRAAAKARKACNKHDRATRNAFISKGLAIINGCRCVSDVSWLQRDNKIALKQGWNVFDLDSGAVAIQRIDDPDAWKGWPGYPDDGKTSEPIFADDELAICWVLANAKNDKTCRKAIRLVYGI
jgi:hypothetical protein